MIYAIIAVVMVFSYLIGSISPAILISKSFFGEDIRSSGSGNAGATNMLRTHGAKFAIITLILDIFKGILGVLFGIFVSYLVNKFFFKDGMLFGSTVSHEGLVRELISSLKYVSGFFVAIGHNFPIFFKFKGGKGVATTLGVLFVLNYQVALIVLVAALLIMAISRYVSLGSIMGAVVFVCVDFTYMLLMKTFTIWEFIFDILIAALLIIRHSANIKRLFSGNENKLFSKNK